MYKVTVTFEFVYPISHHSDYIHTDCIRNTVEYGRELYAKSDFTRKPLHFHVLLTPECKPHGSSVNTLIAVYKHHLYHCPSKLLL